MRKQRFAVNVLIATVNVLIATVLMSAAACSIPEPPPPRPLSFEVASFNLYLVRKQLNATEFEQYRLEGQDLFWECGTIRHGRHYAQEQHLTTVPETFATQMNDALWQLTYYRNRTEHEFDEPGDADTLFDPGILAFSAYASSKSRPEKETKEGNPLIDIRTSLDSISNKQGAAERKLHKFIELLRGLIDRAPCGNKVFFGIGAKVQ